MQGLGGEIGAEFNFIFLLRSNPVPRGNPYPHRYKFGKIDKPIDLVCFPSIKKRSSSCFSTSSMHARAHIENWREHYAELVDKIYDMLKPARVTLGCLRGLSTTIMYARDKSWVKYLTEKSNWGKKPPFSQRLEMYQLVIDKLREDGLKELGICKDTSAMWKALGMDFTEIKCNCVW